MIHFDIPWLETQVSSEVQDSSQHTFRDSSAVEQSPVKRLVAGSNPAPGAKYVISCYNLNMKPARNKAIILIIILIIISICFIQQYFSLQKAHSTFENYYTFRGCVHLISTTTDSGICKTSSGQIIKIVEINNKWYLEGDGPGIW